MEKDNEKIIEPYKAVDLDRNPHGVEKKVLQQQERERHGRYVAILGDKSHTKIFVRDGEDSEKKIAAYLNKIKNRSLKWN